nr:FecR domain-containing protein [uncultured Dyadobacter sp.]
MDYNITPELLSRYAHGRCTPEEVRCVEQWLEHGGEQSGAFSDVIGAGDPVLRDEIWKAVSPRAGARRSLLRYWHAAAAVLVISALALAGYGRWRAAPAVAALKQITFQAPVGQTSVLRFPDGTVVWLQGGGRVSYTEPFRSDSRGLSLSKGKALFEVYHDPRHPFTVRTDNARIQVLGTRFVATHGANSVDVTLINGKVNFLTGKGPAQMLAPGQQLFYDARNAAQGTIAAADTGRATAWTRQVLWFDDTPLSEVMEEIRLTYGVAFRAAPGVDLSRRMNGKFEKQPLGRVLRLLTLSTGYEFFQQKNTVIVR